MKLGKKFGTAVFCNEFKSREQYKLRTHQSSSPMAQQNQRPAWRCASVGTAAAAVVRMLKKKKKEQWQEQVEIF